MKQGFSLLELLVVIVIIGILTVVSIPYYQNAVQSTRMSEVTTLWSKFKNVAHGMQLSRSRADHIEEDINNKQPLNYFTIQLVCRDKETSEICWEAEIRQKEPDQHVQYYLSTEQNFARLVCVPLNRAGENFCQTQSGQDSGPDTSINGRPAYIVRY